jgi:hypothetical protein
MPQPRFYDVFKLEDTCSVCGRTPRVQVSPRGRRGRPWKLCFNEECPSMQEMKRKKAERLAAKAAKEAKSPEGEKAAKPTGGNGAGNGAGAKKRSGAKR